MVGWVALVLLAAAMLFSTLVRWRLREFPLERDEGGMAYMGQLLLHGIPPYQLACHEKLPGIYVAYAALMAIFGETAAGIHLGLLAVNLATVILIFFFAKELFGSLAGGMAAASYSLLAVSPSVLGTAAHATHFVAFFGVAATWVLWRALRSEKTYLLLASGLLFGTAFLMKQHGVFLSGFGGLAVVVHYARRRPFSWRKLLAGSAAFALGVILPYAATCLWLWRAGVFERFWLWTVVYSRSHVGEFSIRRGVWEFCSHISGVLDPNWPLWIAALLGALVVGWAKDARKARWFVFAYFAFSFLCVCPGFFFREHYFIVLLPPVAILSGVGCARLLSYAAGWRMGTRGVEGSRQWPLPKPRRDRRNAVSTSQAAAPGVLLWPAIMLLLAAVTFIVWQQREFFFVWTPTQACQEVYEGDPFWESPVIADYLSRHSTPDQRIAVLGSEPQLYFYARRISATRHIYAYPLVERQPLALAMQEEMCQEIEAAKPVFLVVVQTDTSWVPDPGYSHFIFEWAGSYLQDHYRPVGLVEILSRERTDFRWDDEAAYAQPRTPNHVWIFQRTR
jgi:hypothetical protein